MRLGKNALHPAIWVRRHAPFGRSFEFLMYPDRARVRRTVLRRLGPRVRAARPADRFCGRLERRAASIRRIANCSRGWK
jgi:hypothetical protein